MSLTIQNGSYGSILFITEDHKSFQIKGTISYHTTGKVYDEMKGWLDPKYPGHAAAVLEVEKVYQGADRLA